MNNLIPISRQEIAIDIAKLKDKNIKPYDLEKIELENHKLQALINRILAFEKENYTDYPLFIEPFSLTNLIQDIIKDGKFQFPEASITFNYTDEAPIVADPNLIERAIENIIRNALKYANPEKPQVTVTLDSKDLTYEITIKDNGYGVLSSNLETIFSQNKS